MNKEEMIEEIKKMTVVELADLVKAIEEEFGVSAVAAAAPVAGGAVAGAAEEKSSFNVVLKAAGDQKIKVITAVIMTNGDYLEPTKAIYNFSKKNDFYKIKGGVVEGKVMTAEEIITLAKLPSREELLSMLAGGLLANISKLAIALDQVRVQKEEA